MVNPHDQRVNHADRQPRRLADQRVNHAAIYLFYSLAARTYMVD